MKNIFVSSTFRDMQAERDLIQKEVLPQLKAKAKAYGENMNMIDLRWGVDTSELESEEGSMKVMSVCLDEVERSRPHMLIFLGERYGSIIDPAITERVIARKDSQFKLDDYAISITAMEVEFGALSEQFESLENCVVCMRKFSPEEISDEAERAIYQAEDTERKLKQHAFKEKVMEKVQGRVIEYTCDWDVEKKQLINFRTLDGVALSEKLIATYEAMFEQEWQAYSALSWEEKEQLAVDALQESKLRTFSGRETLIQHYYSLIINEPGALILQGDVGSGKTSIMCKLMEKLSQDGKKVFRFVAGNSSMSETAMQLVQQLVYYLENILGKDHFTGAKETGVIQGERAETDKYSDWLERLNMLAAAIGDEEKVYIAVDALDQMYSDESVRTLDFVLPNEKLRYVMSCTSDYKIPEEEKRYELLVEQVPLLDVSDAKDVIEGILTASSRNVYKEIEDAILAKKSANNPLYISMLIQRLNMMGFDELYSAWTEQDIIRHSSEVIKNMPDTALEAAVFMLDEAIARLDKGKAGLKDVVNLIGISRGGLRESDILAITKEMNHPVNQLDISRLIHYLDTFFVVHKDGQIDFTHKVIRRGVYSKADHDVYIKAIAERIKVLGPEDDFRKKEGMYYARMHKDVRLAESIFIYAGETKDNVVIEAIKAEGLADKGDFYCRCIAQMEGTEEFFCFLWNPLFDLKREETNLKERVSLAFADCLIKKAADKPTEAMLRYVMQAYRNKGGICDDRNDGEQAFVCLEKAVAVAELLYEKKKDEKSEIELCECYDDIGGLLYREDKVEEALIYWEKAFRIRKEAERQNSNLERRKKLSASFYYMGRGLYRLGQINENAEDIQRGIVYYLKDKELSEKIYEEEKSIDSLKDLSVLYMSMGYVYCVMEDTDEAISYYTKAIDAWEIIYGEEQTIKNLELLAVAYDRKAQVLEETEQYVQAEKLFLTALKKKEAVHNARQSYVTLERLKWINIHIGNVTKAQKKNHEAVVYYRKALNIEEQIHKKERSLASLWDMVRIYEEIENPLKELKKIEEQRLLFRKILEMITYIEEIPYTEDSLEKIDDIVYVMDSFAVRGESKTIAFYEKIIEWVLALIKELSREEQSGLELLEACYQHVAVAYADQGNALKAQEYYAKFSEISKQRYKEEHDWLDSILQVFTAACMGFVKIVKVIRNFLMANSKTYKVQWLQIIKMRNQASEYAIEGGRCLKEKDYQKAEECFRKEVEWNEKVCDMTTRIRYLEELAIAYSNLAYILQLNVKIKEAYETYKKSLTALETVFSKKASIEIQRKIAGINSDIARLLRDELQKKLDVSYYKPEVNIQEAPTFFEIALNGYEEVYKKTKNLQDLQSLSTAYYEMGYILRKFGKKEASYAYYIQYRETKEEIHEKQQSQNSLKQLAICYANIGFVLQQMDRVEEGTAYYLKSLKLEEELYMSSVSAESMESLSTSYYNTARAFMRQKKEEAAIEYYKKCVDIAEEFYRTNPNEQGYKLFAKRCDEIGGILLGNGQVEDALVCYEKLVSISEERCEANPDSKEIRDNLENNIYFIGAVLRKYGKYKDALQFYKKYATRAENVYKAKPTAINARNWFFAHMHISDTHEEAGEWEIALSCYEETMRIMDIAMSIKKGNVILRYRGEVLCKCSRIYLRDGNMGEAERCADEAYILLKSIVTEEKDARDGYLEAIAMVVRCNMAKGQFDNCESYFTEMAIGITGNRRMSNMSQNIMHQVRFWELQGDFYAAQSKTKEAKDAYVSAYKQIIEVQSFARNDNLQKLKKELEKKIAAL